MKNEWIIKFKVVDTEARKKRKKSVLSNIHVEVPIEMVGGVVQVIAQEIERIKGLKKNE